MHTYGVGFEMTLDRRRGSRDQLRKKDQDLETELERVQSRGRKVAAPVGRTPGPTVGKPEGPSVKGTMIAPKTRTTTSIRPSTKLSKKSLGYGMSPDADGGVAPKAKSDDNSRGVGTKGKNVVDKKGSATASPSATPSHSVSTSSPKVSMDKISSVKSLPDSENSSSRSASRSLLHELAQLENPMPSKPRFSKPSRPSKLDPRIGRPGRKRPEEPMDGEDWSSRVASSVAPLHASTNSSSSTPWSGYNGQTQLEKAMKENEREPQTPQNNPSLYLGTARDRKGWTSQWHHDLSRLDHPLFSTLLSPLAALYRSSYLFSSQEANAVHPGSMQLVAGKIAATGLLDLRPGRTEVGAVQTLEQGVAGLREAGFLPHRSEGVPSKRKVESMLDRIVDEARDRKVGEGIDDAMILQLRLAMAEFCEIVEALLTAGERYCVASPWLGTDAGKVEGGVDHASLKAPDGAPELESKADQAETEGPVHMVEENIQPIPPEQGGPSALARPVLISVTTTKPTSPSLASSGEFPLTGMLVPEQVVWLGSQYDKHGMLLGEGTAMSSLGQFDALAKPPIVPTPAVREIPIESVKPASSVVPDSRNPVLQSLRFKAILDPLPQITQLPPSTGLYAKAMAEAVTDASSAPQGGHLSQTSQVPAAAARAELLRFAGSPLTRAGPEEFTTPAQEQEKREVHADNQTQELKAKLPTVVTTKIRSFIRSLFQPVRLRWHKIMRMFRGPDATINDGHSPSAILTDAPPAEVQLVQQLSTPREVPVSDELQVPHNDLSAAGILESAVYDQSPVYSWDFLAHAAEQGSVYGREALDMASRTQASSSFSDKLFVSGFPRVLESILKGPIDVEERSHIWAIAGDDTHTHRVLRDLERTAGFPSEAFAAVQFSFHQEVWWGKRKMTDADRDTVWRKSRADFDQLTGLPGTAIINVDGAWSFGQAAMGVFVDAPGLESKAFAVSLETLVPDSDQAELSAMLFGLTACRHALERLTPGERGGVQRIVLVSDCLNGLALLHGRNLRNLTSLWQMRLAARVRMEALALSAFRQDGLLTPVSMMWMPRMSTKGSVYADVLAKRALRPVSTSATNSRLTVTASRATPSKTFPRGRRAGFTLFQSTINKAKAGRAGSLVKQSRSHSTSASIPPASAVMPEFDARNSYDIVIIGGGPAGLALACALLSKPAITKTSRILLIEGGSLDRVRAWNASGNDAWDNRVSSLTAENVQFMRDVGAWAHVDQTRSCDVREMMVWTSTPTSNASSTSQLHFPELSAPMAHLTENVNTQRGLLRRITELNECFGGDRVRISEGKKVMEMRGGEGGRWVALRLGGSGPASPSGQESDDEWVRGGVVVGADGYNSPVRAFSCIPSFGHAYDTHAVVATLHHAPQYNNHTAFQRFLNTGPIAFLPLDAEASTLVWSTRPELAAAYKKLDAETLSSLVNLGFYLPEPKLDAINVQVLSGSMTPELLSASIATELDAVLGAMSATDLLSLPPLTSGIQARSVASFPLKLSHAESYIGQRTVLVGDAAHTVHPLAGQGLNMGLADIRCLCEVWEKTAERGGDYGSFTALLPYAKERYPANHALLSATDKLHHIFRNRIPLVNWARSLGVDLLNELGPLKKALMENAGARAKPARSADHPQSESGNYTRAAAGFDGWLKAKGMAKLVAGAGGEIIKNGARRALERVAK